MSSGSSSRKIREKPPSDGDGNGSKKGNGDSSKKKTNGVKCDICGRMYLNKFSLKSHKNLVHTNRCKYCRERFSTPDLLRQHESRASSILREKCSKCNLEFIYNCVYQKHVNLRFCEDEAGEFQCRFCDKVFYRKHLVLEHEKVWHQGLKRCHTCNKVMAVGDYDEHEKEHAADRTQQHLHKKTSEAPSTCTSTSTRAQSEHVEEDLEHTAYETSHTCSKCKKQFQDSASYERHLRSNDCCPFKCECGKEFSSKKLLETHVTSESLQSNINCSICNNEYWYRCTFEQHVRWNNCKKKPSNCQYCGGNFKTPQLLDLHLESQVLNTPGICLKCGEQFRYDCAYQKHVRSNKCENKQRLVECGNCGQQFLNSNELRIHEENSHKDPSPVLCPLCFMTIDHCLFDDHFESCQKKYQDQLTSTFTNIETPKFEEENHYECSKCPEKFPTESSLQDHLESAHRSPKGATLAVGNMEVKHVSGEKRKGFQDERPQSATKRWRYVTPTSGPASTSTSEHSVSRTGPLRTPPTRQPFPVKISTGDANMMIQNLSETPYVCDYPHCSQLFYSSPAFMDHVGKEHPGYKPFECVICFQRFATGDTLRQHYKDVHFYMS